MDKMKKRNRLGQEEMIGFTVIVIIVSIILVFFLIFSLSNKPRAESEQAKSFLQSTLQYTTTCEISFKHLSVQDLIFSCYNQETCSGGEDSCSVLSDTLKGIIDESWPIGNNFLTKGYKFEVNSSTGAILSIERGNATSTYEGAQQLLPQPGAPINILFTAYS